MAREYVEVTCGKPGKAFLTTVHRLDRPVSGVMCLARTSKAAARLSSSFRGREGVEKTYFAVVEGHLQGCGRREDLLLPRDNVRARTRVLPREPTLEDQRKTPCKPLTGLDWSENLPSLETPARGIGQMGVLDWEAVYKASSPRHSGEGSVQTLVRVRLHTGRKHQIRAQLSAMGHPIIGDVRYGASYFLKDHSILLHASNLVVPHPTRRTPLHLGAPPPLSWKESCARDIFRHVVWDPKQGVVESLEPSV
ncbi:unnamed protein product [Choristocarpus tenellus]